MLQVENKNNHNHSSNNKKRYKQPPSSDPNQTHSTLLPLNHAHHQPHNLPHNIKYQRQRSQRRKHLQPLPPLDRPHLRLNPPSALEHLGSPTLSNSSSRRTTAIQRLAMVSGKALMLCKVL